MTTLASTLLDAPVTLLCVGAYPPDGERDRAPGGEAATDPLAKRVAATGRPLVLADLSTSDAGSNSENGIRAFVGVPLRNPDGGSAGCLFAVDTVPHRWGPREVGILDDLAYACARLLEPRMGPRSLGRDALTGLPDRDFLVGRCQEPLDGLGEDGTVAVLCAGIDNFSQVNQALGSDVADSVLRAVGRRLDSSVRASDIFGRLRGDIFALVAPGIRDEAEAFAIAGRLRDGLGAEPVAVGSRKLAIGATIGIATGRPGDRGGDVVSEAANAMRQAKRRSVRQHMAEAGWSEQALAQLQLREALAGAIGRAEISAVYQPIVELGSGLATGFEALARWEHPELGAVSPSDFIPMAELTGDIVAVGELMLDHALGQISAWRGQGREGIRVSVNVSPLQLSQSDLVSVVETALSRADLPGDAVGLEITEGALLETGIVQRRNLEGLKSLGAQIVLDDFGTGHSALSYLQDFPIDVIKVDRAFVANMRIERTAAAVVGAVLAMADGMGLDVVAEGIETAEQHEDLRELGCRYGQGYLFSRPLPADQVSLV